MMAIDPSQLSNAEKRVLLALLKGDGTGPKEVMESGGFTEQVEVMNAASWLQSKGLVQMKESLKKVVSLDEEGKTYLERKTPERRALEFLDKTSKGSCTVEDLKKELGKEIIDIAIAWLKRNGWVDLVKRGEERDLVLTDKGRAAMTKKGADEEALEFISQMGGEVEMGDFSDPSGLEMLRRRKSVVKISETVVRSLHLTAEGKEMAAKGFDIKDEVSQLSHELITTGKWKGADIRKYNVHAYAPVSQSGKLCPVRMTIEKIRHVFLEMGFTELHGDFIESAFWNMDMLFIPQDHPAREMQDTFYMKEPERMEVDDALAKLVAKVHRDGGGTGSKGWGYEWSPKEAVRPLLRTHTTVNTLRALYEHPEPPLKVFSVMRAFRNEKLDYKHLPEFYQVEGVVVEEGANLRMLMGLLREFYSKMGFREIRIRPSFFPYTEPSFEVDVRFKDKWLEMGGAGIFRPEVTEPLGVKDPVLAWGQGMERITMMRHGLDDIRKLYNNDMAWLRDIPML